MLKRGQANPSAWVQDSEDTQHMVTALRQLGVEIQTDWEAKEMVVHGCGGRFPSEGAELFLGNAGTAMRYPPLPSPTAPRQRAYIRNHFGLLVL